MNRTTSKTHINVQALEDQHRELHLADQQAGEVLTPEGHNTVAEVYMRHNRVDKAMAQYQQALAQTTSTSDSLETVRAWSGMAAIYRQQGRIDQVVECQLEASRAAQATGDPVLEATHLNHLGAAYLLTGNFRLAIQTYSAALQLYTAKEVAGSAASLSGIAFSYYKLGEYLKGMEIYQQMSDLLTGVLDQYQALASACMGLGGCGYKMEDFMGAAQHVGRALALATVHKNETIELEASLSLGNIHLSLQKTTSALEYYQRALDIAEANGDARNQCRSLCGAGLCYYVGGESRGACKLFQNALALDTRVAPVGTGKVPTSGDQMVDEQLLALLHQLLQEHAPQSTTRDMMGTMYLGLTAVTMNGGGVLTPSSLPTGMVDTVIRSLLVAAEPMPLNVVSARYTPYLLHYCMHILQQLVHQKGLRHLMVNHNAVDAVLACMAYPVEDPAPGSSGMQSHTASSKVLRGLLNCPPSGSSREEVCDLFMRSPRLASVLDILPRRTRPTSEARTRQVLDLLTALSTLLTVATSTAADLCRTLKDWIDLRNATGHMLKSDDAITTVDDSSTHDQDTTFDSLSSHSSLMYSGLRPTVSVHKLPIGGDLSPPAQGHGGASTEETDGDDVTAMDDASWIDEWMSN